MVFQLLSDILEHKIASLVDLHNTCRHSKIIFSNFLLPAGFLDSLRVTINSNVKKKLQWTADLWL